MRGYAWCELPGPVRLLVWAIASALIGLLLFLTLVRPVWLEVRRMREEIVRLEARIGPLRTTLCQRKAVPVIAPPEPFSPLAFNARGAQLVRWTPGAGGGELVLTAEWRVIPALFPALAQHGVRVSAFSVTPDHPTRRVLQMEIGDAK